MATKKKPADKKNNNLGLGSLKGAGNAKNRKSRMDSYLDNATGSSSKKKTDTKKKK